MQSDPNNHSHHRIKVDRGILTCNDLGYSSTISAVDPSRSCLKVTSSLLNKVGSKLSPANLITIGSNLLPCIKTIRYYSWTTDLLRDLVAGITIGIMVIPQGMAYSLLAGLPAVYGLYVSFFGSLLYALLGRCPQLSVGTFAIVSLLLRKPIERLGGSIDPTPQDLTSSPTVTLPENNDTLVCLGRLQTPEQCRVLVAITLTFFIGILELLLGICRIGSIMNFMAPQMVNGFITGSSLHVLASQISELFGVIEAKASSGIGSAFLVYVNIIRYGYKINWITVSISAATIIILLVSKLLIDPLIKRRFKVNFPFPGELTTVVIATIVSACIDLENNYKVRIVGDIPQGCTKSISPFNTPLQSPSAAASMPDITVPQWTLFPQLVIDIVVIGLTTIFLSNSLTKMFAVKYNVKYDYNYELIGFGIINIISSFFSSFVQAASLSRSLVAEGAGAVTPLNGIASSGVVLVVLLVLGRYLSSTPKCVLAAIIAVALRNLLLKIGCMPGLWKRSKQDFLLFTSAFLVTVIVDVTYGLLAGIACCLLTLVWSQSRFKLVQVVNLDGTELFIDAKLHEDETTGEQDLDTDNDQSSSDQPRTKSTIISSYALIGPINFANEERLIDQLTDLIDQKLSLAGNREASAREPPPSKPSRDVSCNCWSRCCRGGGEGPSSETELVDHKADKVEGGTITVSLTTLQPKQFLLLDLTGVGGIDSTARTSLRDFHASQLNRGVLVLFVGDKLRCCDWLDIDSWSSSDQPMPCIVYPSLSDARLACLATFGSSSL